ncbi:pyridoxamine 5'-phosphate oxidase family protein [Phenylobacterium sp.]|jgi:PPOX class probable F420-dependent enzyme|uniref:pyridoxamine 5'-phosphate oxidase family protein n=1 Tax=Phenylobacterium sp. TaxID=1871053 RepID=UPI002F3ECD37
MAKSTQTPAPDLKAQVLEILDEHRILSLATLRADGWPQVTIVGYAHDDLTIYCTVGRTSQKLANIERDPRVSIAVGHDDRGRLRGLSLAGSASPVTELQEIQRLNELIRRRYPEQSLFAPREQSCAVLQITPKLISLIDLARGPGLPLLLEVTSEISVRPIGAEASQGTLR